MARVVALLLLALALAGCTVEPPTLQGQLPNLPTAGPPGQSVAGVPLPLVPSFENVSVDAIIFPAPLWVVGDSWRWNVANANGGGGAQQLVVVGETATDYLLATTDRQDAVETAFFGRSLPGRVAKEFLSGYDRGTPTRYFDFPLQTNLTWTLHVRGQDYLVRANFTRTTEGGRGPGMNAEGVSSLGDRVSLQYAPSVKWMTRFQLSDAAGGNQFSRSLVSHSANYTGPYFTARVEDLVGVTRNGTQVVAPVDTFTQGRSYSQLHLALGAVGSGAADVRILDPAGTLRYNFTTSPGGPTDRFEEADLPSLVGGWRIVWNLAGPIEVFLRIAGVDVTEATL